MHYIVIANGDPRTLVLTFRALEDVAGPGSRVTAVLQENAAARFGPSSVVGSVPAHIPVTWLASFESLHFEARNQAVAAAVDPVVILRSGLILKPGFEDAVRRELSRNKAVLWGLSGNRQINDLSEQELKSPRPWDLLHDLRADPGSRILKARCLRPCLFALSLEKLQSAQFEMFSSLPDWYAYKKFALKASPAIELVDSMSPFVGYIEAAPDRRAREEQGRVLYEALLNMKFASAEFASDIARDVQTLIATQGRLLLQPGASRNAAGFLWGMLKARREHARIMRKVRDAVWN